MFDQPYVSMSEKKIIFEGLARMAKQAKMTAPSDESFALVDFTCSLAQEINLDERVQKSGHQRRIDELESELARLKAESCLASAVEE